LDQIDHICQENNAIVLYIEPDAWEGEFDDAALTSIGFDKSQITIQPRRTILVSLSREDGEWLERMKQKTRYNIRLAEKKGVEIKRSSDVAVFNRLMKVTGDRNDFGIHNDEYYRRAYEQFSADNMCELLIAYYQDIPLAGLMVFFKGNRAWYFYGASSDSYRDHMPTYLLQWEAMRWARARGCTVYDLWGVPDADETTLEAQFTTRSDGLWGVYRFKRGFGGELRRTQGPWDRVYNPLLYRLYSWWINRGSSGAPAG